MPDKFDDVKETVSEAVDEAQRVKDEAVDALAEKVGWKGSKKLEDLVRIDVTLNGIEADLASDEGKFEQLQSLAVALTSARDTTRGAINEHEEEIDALEDALKRVERSVSTSKASTAAAFVEVETQIRAWVDVANLTTANFHRIDQILWSASSMSTDLPDIEFFPINIPAQAITEVGKINGD